MLSTLLREHGARARRCRRRHLAAPCMRVTLRRLDELLRQAFALLALVTLAQDEARQIGYCVVAAPRR